MVQAPIQPLTLEDFLKLPDTKPASEFIHNQIVQKPMPQGEHSVIQVELCKVIDRVAEGAKIAKAFSELRCTFGGAAIVPDVSVFRWQRIPRTSAGKIANRFDLQPDWAIEILSPDQSQTKVLKKLLHCSEHGTELGWLIIPADESILIMFPESRIKVFQGLEILPVLEGVNLTLSVMELFNWLTLS
ncbi:MAG: Uma2 family endonuclease [Aphanocapsa sp. GSE-SYN-MK-11-07L]|nr:Uma2 family endonuclease [Aphanocapsa sp. GSE-SYN-MK-11-07L]